MLIFFDYYFSARTGPPPIPMTRTEKIAKCDQGTDSMLPVSVSEMKDETLVVALEKIKEALKETLAQYKRVGKKRLAEAQYRQERGYDLYERAIIFLLEQELELRKEQAGV